MSKAKDSSFYKRAAKANGDFLDLKSEMKCHYSKEENFKKLNLKQKKIMRKLMIFNEATPSSLVTFMREFQS
jgi:hypothetical protein